MPGPNKSESEPLLPTSNPHLPPSTSGTSTNGITPSPARSRLSTRRYGPLPPINTQSQSHSSSQRDKGKGKAREVDLEASAGLPAGSDNEDGNGDDDGVGRAPSSSTADAGYKNGQRIRKDKGKHRRKEERGRHATIIFSNESESTGGNLELWVEDGESVGSVKDQIKTLRPGLSSLHLRLIHSGRLLTDGILLLPWLRSLEERVRRQAAGVGGEVENILKDVGLAEGDDDDDEEGGSDENEDEDEDENNQTLGQRREERRKRFANGKRGEGKGSEREEKERVWLHCIVGGKEEKSEAAETAEPTAPRRRGFDVLLEAGLSADDVAQMRRQFYESRGEEVPEGMDVGDINDEHARALEEQWIEGEMTAETATTQDEGLYSSILHGLLAGFMFPLILWFFFREMPLPNFFDADAEAREVALAQAQAQAQQEMAPGVRRRASTSASASASSGVVGAGTGVGAGSSPSPTEDEWNRRSAGLSVNTGTGAGIGTNLGAGASGVPGLNLGVNIGNNTGYAEPSQVFGKRMQMGILIGTLLNIAFGALRLLN